jgi:hypothetical protein
MGFIDEAQLNKAIAALGKSEYATSIRRMLELGRR